MDNDKKTLRITKTNDQPDVNIGLESILEQLVAEVVMSQRQPGDVTVADFRKALADNGIIVNHRNAYDRLQRKVADGVLQKVILGKVIVYRKVRK